MKRRRYRNKKKEAELSKISLLKILLSKE